ncbi:MAG: putative metal-binding motif-containing protein [Myxococcota bacterium]
MYSETAGVPCNSDGDCALDQMCSDSVCVETDAGGITGAGGSRDVGGTERDTNTTASDTMAEDTTVTPGVGDPCDDGEDCPSGYCIEAAGGGRRVCTDFCDTDNPEACPEGYSCAAVTNAGADVTLLCFPEVDILCTACDSDSDCGGLSDRCVSLTDGDFCARDCRLRACPDGYTCMEIEGDDGALLLQCMPDAGICSGCFDPDGDEHGEGPQCLGLDCNEDNNAINTGAFELCNGIDDNCNGMTDEGYNLDLDPENCGACGTVCSFEGAGALCENRMCLRGSCLENRYDIDGRDDNGCEYFCEAAEDGIEVCNGRDDNCDGQIDEGNPEGGVACDTGEEGVCAQGVAVCQEGRVQCVPNRNPLPESCNGVDDNCDGQTDENNPGGGAACNTGAEGICSDGTLTCTGGQLACIPLREATDEVCNGRDDNCNGSVDEGNPGGGESCDTGENGICGLGQLRCMGSEVVCVQQQQPRDELCNGLDDNCNGQPDEGNPESGGMCDTGLEGICAPGTFQCSDGGLVCQRNTEPRDELCNGLDDNCNGLTDEGNPEGGGACNTGQEGICGPGTLQCSDMLGLVCQRNRQPQSEVCDGIDNDCDGNIDEGRVCGAYVQSRCRLFVGWADRDNGPDTASSTWASCPSSDRDNTGDERCVGTRRDGQFAKLQVSGDVNRDDEFAIALLCDDNANPSLASYIETHCAVYLGQADEGRGSDASPSWDGCPASTSDNEGNVRCTSSGFDRRFRRMLMEGDVNSDDQMAIAWKCVDAGDPNRAAALQSAVDVFMGWADRREGPFDGSPTWGPCPSQASGTSDGQRCVSSRGDGLFHLMQLGGDVNEDDQFGWALRGR